MKDDKAPHEALKGLLSKNMKFLKQTFLPNFQVLDLKKLCNLRFGAELSSKIKLKTKFLKII